MGFRLGLRDWFAKHPALAGQTTLEASHTSVHLDTDGKPVVQTFGQGHVVEGMVQFIDVPPGTTVLIRHLSL